MQLLPLIAAAAASTRSVRAHHVDSNFQRDTAIYLCSCQWFNIYIVKFERAGLAGERGAILDEFPQRIFFSFFFANQNNIRSRKNVRRSQVS